MTWLPWIIAYAAGLFVLSLAGNLWRRRLRRERRAGRRDVLRWQGRAW